jgi:UDP-N-acetylglucosamine 2-epimerase (non-hydrolysing)
MGTNTLVGKDLELLKSEARKILSGKGKAGSVPPLWDGKAAVRIAGIVRKI